MPIYRWQLIKIENKLTAKKRSVILKKCRKSLVFSEFMTTFAIHIRVAYAQSSRYRYREIVGMRSLGELAAGQGITSNK